MATETSTVFFDAPDESTEWHQASCGVTYGVMITQLAHIPNGNCALARFEPNYTNSGSKMSDGRFELYYVSRGDVYFKADGYSDWVHMECGSHVLVPPNVVRQFRSGSEGCDLLIFVSLPFSPEFYHSGEINPDLEQKCHPKDGDMNYNIDGNIITIEKLVLNNSTCSMCSDAGVANIITDGEGTASFNDTVTNLIEYSSFVMSNHNVFDISTGSELTIVQFTSTFPMS